MENLLNCDGRRFSAKISGVYCEGVITVEQGRIYLCQNIKNGGSCADKKGFKGSWLYKVSESIPSYSVTDFRLLEEEPQEGDRVYVSDTDPECKEQAERVFLFKSKKGLIFCEKLGDDTSAVTWKYIRLIPKEVITEVTAEEALEIIAKQKGIDVENVRIKQ